MHTRGREEGAPLAAPVQPGVSPVAAAKKATAAAAAKSHTCIMCFLRAADRGAGAGSHAEKGLYQQQGN